jgi:hypothetical protein
MWYNRRPGDITNHIIVSITRLRTQAKHGNTHINNGHTHRRATSTHGSLSYILSLVRHDVAVDVALVVAVAVSGSVSMTLFALCG